MEPKQLRIKTNCTDTSCPLFSGCPQAPTIIITYTNKPDNIVCSFINEYHNDCSILIQKIMPAVFKYIGLTFNYTITNDIRAFTQKRYYFKVNECCFKYNKRDIFALKPKFIAALGKNANDSISKYSIGISIKSFHGSDWISDVNRIPMTLTYSLATIKDNSQYAKIIAIDIVKGYNMFVKGKV